MRPVVPLFRVTSWITLYGLFAIPAGLSTSEHFVEHWIGVLRDISFAKSVNYIKSCEEVRQDCELRLRSHPNHREYQHPRAALIFYSDSGIFWDFRWQNALLSRPCTSVTGAHFIPVAGHEQKKFNMFYLVQEIGKNSKHKLSRDSSRMRAWEQMSHVSSDVDNINFKEIWSSIPILVDSVGYSSDHSAILSQPFLHFSLYKGIICHRSTFFIVFTIPTQSVVFLVYLQEASFWWNGLIRGTLRWEWWGQCRQPALASRYGGVCW